MSRKKEKEAARVVSAIFAHTTRGSFHFGNNHSNRFQKGNGSARAEEARRELFPKRKRLGLYRTTGEGAMTPWYGMRSGAGRGLYEDDGIDGLYYEGTEGWN